jgi:methanogenic corrinoid protein MtbC1
MEFAEKNQFEPAGALEFPTKDAHGIRTEVAIIRRDFSALSEIFTEKALTPERTDLFLFFSYLYQHRIQLWEVYDHVIQPGMSEIGERWVRGEIGINHERHASYETLDAMAKLQAQILIKPPTGTLALFACVGEELHEIGLRCAANLFESEGWSTHYLGANTPREAVLAAAIEMKPAAVCLSFTRVELVRQNASYLKEMAGVVHSAGGWLLLGGGAAGGDTEQLRVFDKVLVSMRALLDFIDGVGRTHPATAFLNQPRET